MANTVIDVSLSVLAVSASDAGVELCAKWVSERYVEFVSRARTHQLQHYASVYVPAPISAGTVSVTSGSGTAVLNTPLPSQLFVGWTFRVQNNWFVVTAVAGDKVTLTLDSAYSETTNAAASYQLVQRYIPIMADTRWVSEFAHQRRRKRLKHLSRSQFEARYPSRQLVGAYPWTWTEAPRFVEDLDISATLGTAGQRLIEIYPPSSIAENYVYTYWQVPSPLSVTSVLPPEIDPYVLREGVLIDVYRYKGEQALKAGNAATAEVYMNKESRQRTTWEVAIQNAQVADQAYHNEMEIQLSQFDYADEYDHDITTAHEDVVMGWTL